MEGEDGATRSRAFRRSPRKSQGDSHGTFCFMEGALLVLIAVATFAGSFALTYAFAVRFLRRWLSTSSGVPLADFAETSFDRLEGNLDRMESPLARAEWSSRLLERELRNRR
jgi:hypothetical protein